MMFKDFESLLRNRNFQTIKHIRVQETNSSTSGLYEYICSVSYSEPSKFGKYINDKFEAIAF